MKAIKVLLIPALAALALATVADAQAQTNPMSRQSARSAGGAGIGTTSSETQRHWRGDRGGHWRGDGDGRWRGDWDGHRHRRHGHWHFGFMFGAPILWPTWYWGHPYYDPWFYPYPRTYVYREVERWPEIHPADPPAESTQLPPRTEGAPTQGPLYLNYCESAKAYYPKVTACPEGWRLMTPTN